MFPLESLRRMAVLSSLFAIFAANAFAQDSFEILPGFENKMKYIEGGAFKMGDSFDVETGQYERPAHQVTLGGFYMSQFEVTAGMYRLYVKETGASWLDGSELMKKYVKDNHPVTKITWDEARAFCLWLSKKTGKDFRLPFEAEWEYAASEGGKPVQHLPGMNPNMHSYEIHNSFVGTQSPNALGIYDLDGNVAEWCEDWFGGYSASPQTNPKGPAQGKWKVLRGPSPGENSTGTRVSSRLQREKSYWSEDIGIRLCISADK